VPTRVTISVPDDLHAAIQAARGKILLEWAIDIPYSAMVELLTVGGVKSVAEYYSGKLTDSQDWAIGYRMREGFDRAADTAGGSVGDLPVDAVVSGMLPVLIKRTLPEVLKNFGKDFGPDGNYTLEAKRATAKAARRAARQKAKDNEITGPQHDLDRAPPSQSEGSGS
jgi:hypothetical protein